MEHRILMCRFEVETNRGMIWMVEGEEGNGAAKQNTPPAGRGDGANGSSGGVYL